MITYFVIKNCRMPTTMAAQELIFCQTRLLRCLLDFDDGVASDLPKAIEGCFLFSMIWSVGACVDGEGRRKFDLFFRAVLAGQIEQSPEYLDFKIKNPDYVSEPTREAKVPVPEGDDVYSYFFDGKQARWINWLENRPVFKIPSDAKFNAIMVPTIDTIRNEWLVEKLLVKGYHVMATGDTGTGKSLSIKNKLLSGMPAKFNSININFSAQTTANQTQGNNTTHLAVTLLSIHLIHTTSQHTPSQHAPSPFLFTCLIPINFFVHPPHHQPHTRSH